MPLLMIGGVYLAFEGTEKLVEFFIPHKEEEHEETKGTTAKEIEETTVSGAIRTDFILSAEIMALTLAGLPVKHLYAGGHPRGSRHIDHLRRLWRGRHHRETR